MRLAMVPWWDGGAHTVFSLERAQEAPVGAAAVRLCHTSPGERQSSSLSSLREMPEVDADQKVEQGWTMGWARVVWVDPFGGQGKVINKITN